MSQQTGNNLGERMFNSLDMALEAHDFAVIIGSDCPLLDKGILDRAYDLLAHDHYRAVLGPSDDGGYYLIGVDRAVTSLFDGIPWGSDSVTEMTRAAMKALGWQWAELTQLWDVDNPPDLERLRHCRVLENRPEVETP